jgi:anti-sigma B factor antagonist
VPALSPFEHHPNTCIALVERDGAVLVVVEGELDLVTAGALRESLARAGASRAPSIILDLDRVSFMDSAGVHAIVGFSGSAQGRDRLGLTSGSPQVRRLLEVSGARRFLTFVPAPDASLSSDGLSLQSV